MLLDANDLDHGAVLDADLCIAGAGAAGITLALQFLDSGRSVLLLEGGGLKRETDVQNLYAGTSDEPLADGYPLMSRLRLLGGTTNHWIGACLTFDPIDFTARDWVPDSGWPFERSELRPYYMRAAEVAGISPPAFDDVDPTLFEGSMIGVKQTQGHARRFGEVYREQLEEAPALRLVLNANVVRVALGQDAGSVEQLDLATLGGKRLAARAKCFVLALGGIENSRMLLVSDDVQSTGVGNAHDLVGRYWMDHSGFPVAAVCVSDRDRTLVTYRPQGGRVLRLNEEIQRRHRLVNCGLMFNHVPLIEDTRHALLRDGAWQRLAPYLEDSGIRPESSLLGRFDRHRDDKLYYRRFSLLPEQIPTPDSRVTLGTAEDPFGLRRVHMQWSLPPETYRTARKTAELFAEDLGRRGLGRVAVDFDALEGAVYQPGFHHMGGTRMHPDPRQGVVDGQCRVHSVANLYLAGSSVFPTSSYANPTFTILAMTLRLADYLASRLGREA
ncbi:MAG: GMC family oxidoreductase [bacterium]|nr:GMC family oxidoreductase [bacterium]